MNPNNNMYKHLPYNDQKPIGAADFYFAINATFRFIYNTFGMDGLIQYWQELGSHYFAPVSKMWKEYGLKGVEQYWTAFFQSEPDGEVKIVLDTDHVKLIVRNCPAICHLRAYNRDIVPCFCQQCYYINTAIAEPANLTVRVKGGNGQCQQFFYTQQSSIPPQDICLIKEVTC